MGSHEHELIFLVLEAGEQITQVKHEDQALCVDMAFRYLASSLAC